MFYYIFTSDSSFCVLHKRHPCEERLSVKTYFNFIYPIPVCTHSMYSCSNQRIVHNKASGEQTNIIPNNVWSSLSCGRIYSGCIAVYYINIRTSVIHIFSYFHGWEILLIVHRIICSFVGHQSTKRIGFSSYCLHFLHIMFVFIQTYSRLFSFIIWVENHPSFVHTTVRTSYSDFRWANVSEISAGWRSGVVDSRWVSQWFQINIINWSDIFKKQNCTICVGNHTMEHI